jgi:hypothetical protein
MAQFRDPVARDRAYGRYYARHGLRPVTKDTRQTPNPLRLAEYQRRKAMSGVIRY